MEKFRKALKSFVLASALAVTALGAFPAIGESRISGWELVCSGPADYCGTVDDGFWHVEVYGWAFESFTVFFERDVA